VEVIDLTGQVFSRLTVIGRAGHRGRSAAWSCVCECGKESVVSSDNLRRGKIRSCGCFRLGHVVALGITSHPEYKTWSAMKNRCFNVNNPGYKWYGGRGITVCDRWLAFESFCADMGPKPEGLTLDRTDNDGNYEPTNCRWATREQQARNQSIRSTNKTGIKGVSWCKRQGRWKSYISIGGKLKYLYSGNDFFEACCRRRSAELEHY